MNQLFLSHLRNSQRAFTLAELLVAMYILAVIATYSIPKVLASQQNGKYKALQDTFHILTLRCHGPNWTAHLNQNNDCQSGPDSFHFFSLEVEGHWAQEASWFVLLMNTNQAFSSFPVQCYLFLVEN